MPIYFLLLAIAAAGAYAYKVKSGGNMSPAFTAQGTPSDAKANAAYLAQDVMPQDYGKFKPAGDTWGFREFGQISSPIWDWSAIFPYSTPRSADDIVNNRPGGGAQPPSKDPPRTVNIDPGKPTKVTNGGVTVIRDPVKPPLGGGGTTPKPATSTPAPAPAPTKTPTTSTTIPVVRFSPSGSAYIAR